MPNAGRPALPPHLADLMDRPERMVRLPNEQGAVERYVREHAQEMSEDVMYRHIDLYVNQYSIDLGAEGRRAVEVLFERAGATGLIPEVKEELFLDA